MNPQDFEKLKSGRCTRNNHEEQDDQIHVISHFRRTYPGFHTMVCPIVSYGTSLQRARHWGTMNKMGYEKGTLDIFFAVPLGEFHGLFIEIKKLKGSRTAGEQYQMVRDMIQQGYCAVVCHGHQEAIKYLDKYMTGGVK